MANPDWTEWQWFWILCLWNPDTDRLSCCLSFNIKSKNKTIKHATAVSAVASIEKSIPRLFRVLWFQQTETSHHMEMIGSLPIYRHPFSIFQSLSFSPFLQETMPITTCHLLSKARKNWGKFPLIQYVMQRCGTYWRIADRSVEARIGIYHLCIIWMGVCCVIPLR